VVIRATLILLALALPARAGEAGRDEDFALALIFDHCLAFVRDGATPFRGIAAPAPPDDALAALAPWFPASSHALRLNDWSYLAFWGTEGGKRFCALIEADQEAPDGMRTGPDFMEQVTARAQGEGLANEMLHEAYARRDGRWIEPRFLDDPQKGIVVSVSVGPLGSATEHVQALGASAPVMLAN
jgi:hypothetical protein